MNTVIRLTTALALALSAALAVSAPADAARNTGHVVAAGDSIVLGSGAPAGQSWPDHLRASCGNKCTVSNVGEGGTCLVSTACGETLLSTFDAEVLAQRPAVAIVSIGRNDLCHVPTDTIIDAYLRLRGRARNAGVRIYFGTITPAGTGWRWPCEEQRIEVNTRLRQMPNVIDFEQLVINQRGLLRWIYDSGDGLHLNSTGYSVLGRAAWSAIRA